MASQEKAFPAATALLAAMALLGAFYLAWPVYRAALPMEIDVNEPWNAHWADVAWRRTAEPLYPNVNSFLVNNYPPLSFYVIGGVAAITGDPVAAGRWISILALVAIALGAAACVRWLGGSRWSAALAGIWTLATFARFFESYVGMDDPHLLALAVMVGALAWFIRRRKEGRAVEPAILAMVAAGFFKHTLFVAPITAIAWLALDDWRKSLRAAGIGMVAAAAGLLCCAACFGGDFFRQMFIMPREYSLVRALNSLGRLQWVAPALVIFWIWTGEILKQKQADDAARFSLLFTGVAVVLYFLQKMGAGVDDNAQFELVIATAVGLGLAFDRLDVIPLIRRIGVNRGRIAVLAILIVRLLICSRTEPYLLAFSSAFRDGLPQQVAVTKAETARIAKTPGLVVGFTWQPDVNNPDKRSREALLWRYLAFSDGGPKENFIAVPTMLLCRQAGKPFCYDAFVADQRAKLGVIPLPELKHRLNAAGIRFVEVDHRVLTGRN